VKIKAKVKVKLSLYLIKYHTMKTYPCLIKHHATGGVEEWRYSSTTSTCDGGEWSFHTRRRNPQYPLDKRIDGSQSRSGSGDKEKNSQPLLAIEPRSSSP
jgi:hypothetical protein